MLQCEEWQTAANSFMLISWDSPSSFLGESPLSYIVPFPPLSQTRSPIRWKVLLGQASRTGNQEKPGSGTEGPPDFLTSKAFPYPIFLTEVDSIIWIYRWN